MNVPETTDLLTGLVVGDDDPENDNVLQDSINIGRELPALRKFCQLKNISVFCLLHWCYDLYLRIIHVIVLENR